MAESIVAGIERLIAKGQFPSEALADYNRFMEGSTDPAVQIAANEVLDALALDYGMEPEPPKNTNGHAARDRLLTQNLGQIVAEGLTWLWEGRIPFGKITCLQGPPGVGKSQVSLAIAAKVSRGHPITKDDLCPKEPGHVILVTGEDDYADTIIPRLQAVYADLAMFSNITGALDEEGRKTMLLLPADIEAVNAEIRARDARLIIIDGFQGYLSASMDSHKDKDVRRSMIPLAELAQDTGAAFLLIGHLNKSQGMSAVNRGMGSVAFNAVFRSVLVADKDKEDETGRTHVLARSKGNLSADEGSIEYRIVSVDGGTDALGRPIKTSRVEWGGASKHSADSLLAENVAQADVSSFDEAKEFLKAQLEDGPAMAKTVTKEAKDCAIAIPTLKKAKKALQVVSVQKKGAWVWSLPEFP